MVKSLTRCTPLMIVLSVCQINVAQIKDESKVRRLEALICIIDIPIDVGLVFEHTFDTDRVQRSVSKLDQFSLAEIEWALDEYLRRPGSDQDTDRMVKSFLINSYIFDFPADIQIDKELAYTGYSFFLIEEDERNLKYPWKVNPNGSQTLLIQGVTPRHVSGTGYSGAEVFKMYRQRFRRFSRTNQ